MRPTEEDLFSEEQSMRSMSFGDHIEELRVHLILALLGLFVGMVIAFLPPMGYGKYKLPPVNLGQWVVKQMQEPAQVALTKFYADRAVDRAKAAEAKGTVTAPLTFRIEAKALDELIRKFYLISRSRRNPCSRVPSTCRWR
jgi:sec-independent protein translocase protein TatC